MRKPFSNRATAGGRAPQTAPTGGYAREAPTRTKTTPLSVPRTIRHHDIRVLTSLPAGKMVPIAAIPMLREDAISRCSVRLSFEMMETVEILMNAVNVNVKAYLVPHLAFPRFKNSMDLLNHSYENIPWGDDPTVPFFRTGPIGGGGAQSIPILKYMGKHSRDNSIVNWGYVEAYNLIWNFRAANRSPDIMPRSEIQSDLAPAFWQHQGFAHIVPDFDQAMIDGEVPLNVMQASLPVRGIGVHASATGTLSANNVRETSGIVANYPYATQADNNVPFINMTGNTTAALPQIFAEMNENGLTVSLSNIELAKKTQAFAELRRQYSGHSDDYIIDLLMDGIQIPDANLMQPMLIADRSTMFGMSKRYATDGASLTDSVVNGATFVDLSFSVPRLGVGGLVMIVAEITPEQMFERQEDPYFNALGVAELPQFLRDTLDPEKVVIVENQYVDVDHDTPTGVFGYAPLNHEWNSAHVCIGGRFHRPKVDAAFDEDRQRIWAVETENPVLSQDFYLCTNMHTKPFVVTDQDPFEVVARGSATIVGNTVFGKLLIEASDDYEEVMAEAPIDTIDKPVGSSAKADGDAEAAE